MDDTHTAPHVSLSVTILITICVNDNKSKKGTDVGYSHWRCAVSEPSARKDDSQDNIIIVTDSIQD